MYDSYTDQNGVKWTIIATPDGYTMMGTVREDEKQARVYDPPAQDQIVKQMPRDATSLTVNNIEIKQPTPPTSEETRLLFIQLTAKIEDFALHHRNQVDLEVTAAPPWGRIALLVGLILLLDDDKRGRRRR